MKTKQLLIMTLAALFASACSTNNYVMNKEQRAQAYEQFKQQEQLVQVDNIRSFNMHTWSALGDNHLILSASPSRPYLITLQNKCSNLDYIQGILIKKRGPMLNAKFDYIKTVDTVSSNCYIETIHKLNKDQEKSLLAIGRKDEKTTNES